MFIILLAVTFVISLAVSGIAVLMFARPIDGILHRIISDPISQAWTKYVKFAIYVVGISSGVRIWQLERYITPGQFKEAQILQLTRDRWVLEVYRTVIESLQGIAWLLLVFFAVALIAFVIVRAFELRRTKGPVASS
jgi:ABC-type transport system involved in multi-copper enzyme maturation permease subunit